VDEDEMPAGRLFSAFWAVASFLVAAFLIFFSPWGQKTLWDVMAVAAVAVSIAGGVASLRDLLRRTEK
jgi:hypothetical protein